MHQLNITGHIGKDAEVRTVPSGYQAIGFRVAVNDTYYDSQKQKQEKTTWYQATLWVKPGGSTKVAESLVKGQAVRITGKPSAHAYLDKEQKPQAELRVNVDELEFIGASVKKGHAENEADDTPEFSLHSGAKGSDDNDLPF